MRTVNTVRVVFAAMFAAFLSVSAFGQTPTTRVGDTGVSAAADDSGSPAIAPIRTGSPRQKIESFIRLHDQLETRLARYRDSKTEENARQLEMLFPQFQALYDLSDVPAPAHEEVGIELTGTLLDIFGRVPLPPLDEIPDETAFADDDAAAFWRVPGTPIRIVRIDEGPREGEFLFSSRSLVSGPRFAERIADEPLATSLGIESWSDELPQLTGRTVPAWLESAIPSSLRMLVLHTPVWKIFAAGLITFATVLVVSLVHRALPRLAMERRPSVILTGTLTPILCIIVARLLAPYFLTEINVSGSMSTIVENLEVLVLSGAGIWLSWLVLRAVFEWIIHRRKLPSESFDAHLWRLGGNVIAIIVSLVIVGWGAQQMGLPLYSILAGLGIGGLAVALAIRPTLENLIGGIILYIDQPLRVGDFCQFGDKTGTIESIGIRSTKVRALDRTIISVPNAALADMQITNYAKCDRMLIDTAIGVRYETSADQIRYILIGLRKMMHAHPKVDSDTVRVRLSGYGDFSQDISIRIYALTNEWNEYYAIQEDLMLRVREIVEAAGAEFAFPSQTLYLSRDGSPDLDARLRSEEAVADLRRQGKLPFPRLSQTTIDGLRGTLDYPPRGSVERALGEEPFHPSDERLSNEAVLADDEQTSETKMPS